MVSVLRRRHGCVAQFVAAGVVAWTMGGAAHAQTNEILSLRGKDQSLRIYGTRGGEPVIVSSGDGGWIHLGPHVAQFLAARGFFVIGFDVKVYLSSFTSERSTLRPEDEPADYRTLTGLAQKATEIGRASCRERA